MLLWRIVLLLSVFVPTNSLALSSYSKMGLKNAPKITVQSSSEPSSKVTEFDKLVYDACSRVPKGKVATYKEIAKEIGRAGAFRAVGSSLRRNPFAPKVPCHRVVASDLSLGGFYGSKDPRGDLLLKKVSMLMEEGVQFNGEATTTAAPTTVKGRKVGDASKDKVGGDTSKVRVAPESVFTFHK